MKTMTLKEFAEHQGVTQQMVSKWRSQGRLVLIQNGDSKRPIVNVEASTRLIRNTTSLSRAGNGANSKSNANSSKAETLSASLAVKTAMEEDEMTAAFKRARLHREEQDAMMAELNLKEKAGELVQAALVDKTITAVASEIRLALERIPTRLSVQLTEMTDRVAIELLLTQSIDEVLADLADNIRRQRQDFIDAQQASDNHGVDYEAI